MTKITEHVEIEKLPPVERCFVLGAGASYDSGVPVESYILDAANWVADHLRFQPAIGEYETKAVATIEQLLADAKRLGVELIGPLDPFYQQLDVDGQAKLSWLVVFVLSRVRWHQDHSDYYYRRDLSAPDESYSYQRFKSELKPSDLIVTFNYDTFLEGGISPPWKVHYGAPISPWPTNERYPIRGEDERNTIRILRLHGSAGWLACPRCGCTEDFGYMNINELGISSLEERQIDADAYCPKCMRQMGMSELGLENVRLNASASVYQMFEREHCMILPAARRTYDKEPLKAVWSLAEAAFSVCREIIVIGYSIPPVDVAFRDSLTRAISGRRDLPSLAVIDPSSATQNTWKTFAMSIGLPSSRQKTCTFSDWLDDCGVPPSGSGSSI